MAVVDRMTMEVKVGLNVDDRTAETCLRIVELYVNSNNVTVLSNTREDGSLQLIFKPNCPNDYHGGDC